MIFIKPNIALLLFTFFAQTYSVEGESKLPIVGFVVCIVFSLASFASIRSYIGTHQYGMKNYEQYSEYSHQLEKLFFEFTNISQLFRCSQ